MDAHQVRNNKTSLMFTLSVAFLFFAASSFELLDVIVLKAFDKIIGADIFIFSALGMLDEQPIADYLTSQMNADEKLVSNYAFTSISFAAALTLGSNDGNLNYVMGAS